MRTETVKLSRSPILGTTRGHSLLGYELCFAGDHSKAGNVANEVISRSLLTLGLGRIVGDARAFIRFEKDMVLDKSVLLLPAESVVMQLGPDCWAEMDPRELVQICRDYRRDGYRIALDEFTLDLDVEAIGAVLDQVSFVKMRLGEESESNRENLAKLLGPHFVHVIATDVNDEHERDIARAAGVHYVQGYYFAKPSIVQGRDLPGFKISYMSLLQASQREDIDFRELADIIKHDVALSYKLLRYVNSSAVGLRGEVESVTQALALMGINQIRRWAIAATVTGLVGDRPDELARLCVIRARFCEALADRKRPKMAHDAFTVGMFSLLDVLLGQPMQEALQDVPMGDRARTALISGEGPLAEMNNLAVAYEQGEWEEIERICVLNAWDQDELLADYIDALEWSRGFFSIGEQPASQPYHDDED